MERDKILDIATEVLIANGGASMHDIAIAAGIGRTTLHRHFSSRAALMRALLDAALDAAERAIEECRVHEGTVIEALTRVAEAFVPLGHRYHFLLGEYRYTEDSATQGRMARLNQRFETLMRRGQRDGTLRTDLPVGWMNDVLGGLLFAAWDAIRDGRIARRAAPRLVVITLVQGCGGDRDDIDVTVP